MTEELAYIIGVYLGDGSVYSNKKNKYLVFSLEVIDLEFAQKTKNAIEKIIGHSLRDIKIRHRNNCRSGLSYRIRCYDYKLCKFLVDSCNGKQIIPEFIPLGRNILAKGLMEGLMDSEGCVWNYKKIQPRYKSKTFKMQISMNTVRVIDRLAEYFKAYGVKTHGRRVRILPSGKEHIEYTICLLDYMQTDLKFNINRKQNKIEEYRQQLLASSETEIFTKNRKNTVSPLHKQ